MRVAHVTVGLNEDTNHALGCIESLIEIDSYTKRSSIALKRHSTSSGKQLKRRNLPVSN